ncbi:sister chromatid cohesion protein 1 [Nowakowskiella sp. JEL0407]|nr:sister chromatid cohesion protein 1 [Nowakowskiella sp. JEL0407]
MFFTDVILGSRSSKKLSKPLSANSQSLARIWLAAHMERKLTKSQFLQTNLSSSISSIVNPSAEPIALRLSGQLLLGVVRIFARKAKYLLDDCTEAINKIKLAFKAGDVDMPVDVVQATVATITMTDNISEFDILFPDPALDIRFLMSPDQLSTSQTLSRTKDITLTDDSLFSFTSQTQSQNSLSIEADDVLLSAQDTSLESSNNDDEWQFNLGFEEDTRDELRDSRDSVGSVEVARRDDGGGDIDIFAPPASPGMINLDIGEEKGRDSMGSVLEDVEMQEPQIELPNDQMELEDDRPAEGLLFDVEGAPTATFTELSKSPSPVPDEQEDQQSDTEIPRLTNTKQQKKRKPRTHTPHADAEIDLSARIIQEQLSDPSDLLSNTYTFLSSERGVVSFVPEGLMRFCEERSVEFVGKSGEKGKKDNGKKKDDVGRSAPMTMSEPSEAPEFQIEYGEPSSELTGPEVEPEFPVFEETEGQMEGVGESGKRKRASSVSELEGMEIEPEFIGNEELEVERMSEQAEEVFQDDQVVAEELKKKRKKRKELIEGDVVTEQEIPGGEGEYGYLGEIPEIDEEVMKQRDLEDDEVAVGKGFSKSAVRTIKMLQARFEENEQADLQFNGLTEKANRSDTVRLFFEVLVLKTRNMINVRQDEPYGDITISAVPSLFNTELEDE